MPLAKISVLRLQVGNHVLIPSCVGDVPFLASEFQIQTDVEIDLLRMLNVKQVAFIPDRSATSPLPSADIDSTRNIDVAAATALKEKLEAQQVTQTAQLQQHKQSFMRAQEQHKQGVNRSRAIMNKVFIRPSHALNEAQAFIDDICHKIMDAGQSHLHLNNNNDLKENKFSHTLNVVTLSMVLAKAANLDIETMKEVGLAAFFHGLDKQAGPDQCAITLKHDPHTLKTTLEQLGNIPDFPEAVVNIISQHCERCDGSGFPQNLNQKDIHIAAQMVGLVDEFHVMCATLAENESARTPYMALSTLYAHKKLQFNTEHLELLVKTIGVYPPGSVVRLSNKQVAVVVSVNSDLLLKPVVMVYEPKLKPQRTRLIDLSSEDLAIEQACALSRLSEEERRYLIPKRSGFFIDPS